MKKYFVVVMLLLFTAEAGAKALYMTVRRDFSSKEEPEIELNYSSPATIQMRVLAPKDLKAFIASQIDLRRAWREPKEKFNPAHFLFAGQNQSDLQTAWLRDGMDEKLRKDLIPKAGGAYLEEEKARMAPGPKRLIMAPEGFEVVKEVSLKPEEEDNQKPFDVPGFNWYFGSRGLKTKMVKLPALEPGFYVLQVLQDGLEGQVVVVVNEIMAQMQHSGSQVLYRVANRDGQPVKGANIEMRNLNGKWIGKGETDANGEFLSKDVKETDLITVVTAAKSGTAIIDSEYYSSVATFPDLYLYTDRPMYKKGHTVHFRGILRELSGGVSSTGKAGKKVMVELQRVDGTSVGKSVTVTAGEFGTFSGSLTLGTDKGDEGLFRVVASLAKVSHSGEVRVKDYVKPLFFVNILTDREALRPGDKLEAKLKAERYAGGVPTIASVRGEVYRVRVSAPQWIEDAGLGETGSTTTYGFAGDHNDGGALLPELIGSIENVAFDDQGMASFSFEVPNNKPAGNYNYQYQVKFTFVDSDDNIVFASKSFMDLASDVVAQARFDRIVIKSAGEAKLQIRSVTASGKPFPSSKGQVEFLLQGSAGSPKSLEKKNIETDKKGLLTLALPSSVGGTPGEIIARITLNDGKKRPSDTEATVLMAGNKEGEAILDVAEARMVSNEFMLAPSDKASLFVLLPKGWGEKGGDEGRVYLTIAGSKIHSHRSLMVKGNSFWIEEPLQTAYGTGVYLVMSYASKQGWVERRSAFRIVDEGKNLRVTVKPAADLTYPGTEQGVTLKVLDKKGQPVRAEVSISVVDRSVLDLQPEIRPPLLDFFYPLAKLNLMTFLSTQFQGYGYGESLAKLFQPNFNLAAAKQHSKPLDQADTAYWNAKVVTDAKGEAKVNFTLPGNQTIWHISAVAVDNSGRFGEGEAEFKANIPVSILLGMPAFLRKGDEAYLRVNLTGAGITSATNVKYTLASGSKFLAFEKPVDLGKSIKPKEQLAQSFKMGVGEVKNYTTADMNGTLVVGKSTMRFRDNLLLLGGDAQVPEYFFPSGNKIPVYVGKNERVLNAELHLAAGFSDVLVPSMRWLISYPYGCVEQTISTTMPNLVLGDWLERAEKRGVKLSEDEKKLLKDAKEFGASGLGRLKSFTAADGGFKWFGGEGTSDPNMTMMVLGVLAAAPNSPGRLAAFLPAYNFLKKQNYAPASAQGIFFTYIEAAFEQDHSVWLNDKELAPRLKVQLDYVKASGNVMEKAMLLTAMSRYRRLKSMQAEKQQLASALIADLKPNLVSPNPLQRSQWNGGIDGWDAYPGRFTSALAMVVQAVNVAKVPEAAGLRTQLKWHLLNQFNGENFGSTWDTSQTLLAAVNYLDEEIDGLLKTKTAAQVRLSVNGQEVKASDLKRTSSLLGSRFSVPVDRFKANASNEVTVETAPNVIARLATTKAVPYAQVQKQVRGWEVQRKYFRLNSNGKREEMDPGKTQLKVGDLVYAEVIFLRQKESSPGRFRSRYYMLSDSLPAGMTVVQEDKTYEAAPFGLPLRGAKSREILNNEVRWYFDFTHGWMDRNIVIGYVMRANYPGAFEAGVTRIEDFYDQTQVSLGPSARFNIQPVR